MKQVEKNFKKNLEKIDALLIELMENISNPPSELMITKEILSQVFMRLRLLIDQCSDDKSLSLNPKDGLNLCRDFLSIYVINPDLFCNKKNILSGDKIEIVSEIVKIFAGEKQAQDMKKLIQRINLSVYIDDSSNNLLDLISMESTQIFSKDFELQYIKKHQRETILNLLDLLVKQDANNKEWIHKLTESLYEIDSALIAQVSDFSRLESTLNKLYKEIENKILNLEFESESRTVLFHEKKFTLTISEYNLAEYLWLNHKQGNYWVTSEDIKKNKDIIKVRDILRSSGKYRKSYNVLFTSKESEKYWRIKF